MNDTEYRDACIRATLDEARVDYAVFVACVDRGEPTTRASFTFYERLAAMPHEDLQRAVALLLERHEYDDIQRMADGLQGNWNEAEDLLRRLTRPWWHRRGKHRMYRVGAR